jgi:hypothetical protein
MKDDPYGTADMFDPSPYVDTSPTVKPKALPSFAQGNCPQCSRTKTGLIRTDRNHLMWRMHTYKTHGGSSVPCAASGTYVCNQPEASPPYTHGVPVRCPHYGRGE